MKSVNADDYIEEIKCMKGKSTQVMDFHTLRSNHHRMQDDHNKLKRHYDDLLVKNREVEERNTELQRKCKILRLDQDIQEKRVRIHE